MLARLAGLCAIVPMTLILTVSFFVLFALREVKSNVLKAFGYVIAALLWISALLIFSVGVYTLATGRSPMHKMMQKHEMMCQKMMDKQMMGKPMMEKSKMHEMKQ